MDIYGNAEKLLQFKFEPVQFSQKGVHTISPHTIEHIKKICLDLDKKITDTVASSLGDYDPEEYYNRFMDHADKSLEDLNEYFSTRRDKRRLSSVISYMPRNTDKSPIILSKYSRKAINFLEEDWSNFVFSKILYGVLNHWNQIHDRKLNEICELLVNKIQSYNGDSITYKKLKDDIYYHQYINGKYHCFSFFYGPLYMADDFANKGLGIDYIYKIAPFKTSQNGYEFISNYIWGYTKAAIHHKKFDAQQNDIMNRLELFKCKDTIKKTLPLIIVYVNDFIENKDIIFSKCIDLIGDPADDVKWMPPKNSSKEIIEYLDKAREILSIWLTGQFIEIFFDKLARITNNFDERRYKFWKLYLRNITFFKIYGSQYHLNILNKDDRIRKLLPNRFGILDGPQESAFCFTIQDRLFVEFVHTGNALYVYQSNKPYCPKLSSSRMHVNDLKSEIFRNDLTRRIEHGKSEGRLLHNHDWEGNLHKWFKNKLGIVVSARYNHY